MPKKQNKSVRLYPETIEEIEGYAEQQRISESDALRNLIHAGLDERTKTTGAFGFFFQATRLLGEFGILLIAVTGVAFTLQTIIPTTFASMAVLGTAFFLGVVSLGTALLFLTVVIAIALRQSRSTARIRERLRRLADEF